MKKQEMLDEIKYWKNEYEYVFNMFRDRYNKRIRRSLVWRKALTDISRSKDKDKMVKIAIKALEHEKQI